MGVRPRVQIYDISGSLLADLVGAKVGSRWSFNWSGRERTVSMAALGVCLPVAESIRVQRVAQQRLGRHPLWFIEVVTNL